MDDLIAIAAYAIIMIIIGVVSVVKKIQAEQKKRQILTQKRARLRPQLSEQSSGGLRASDIVPKTIEAQRPEPEEETLEEMPEPIDEPEPVLDMEVALRRALGFPSAKTPPVLRRVSRKKALKPQLVQPSEEKIPLPQPEPVEIKPSPYDSPLHLGWSDFVETLKARNLSDLQRTIIFTEVIGSPLALRRGNQFRKRGRLFG